LSSRRNCSSDGAERTDDGRAFHARAADTGKARSPSVVHRVNGMTSVDVEALRRRRRELTSALSGGSQQGMTAPCQQGNDTREHIAGTEFSLELSTNVVLGGVELCALTSLRRTRDERQQCLRRLSVSLSVTRLESACSERRVHRFIRCKPYAFGLLLVVSFHS